MTAVDLPDFEGLPVRQVGIEIRGVAGGLQDAIKVDPQLIRKGDKVRVELLLDTYSIRVDPIDKDNILGDQRRVVIFHLDTALVHPPGEHNVEAFAEQKRKIQRMREQEAGVDPLKNETTDATDWGGPGPLDEAAEPGNDEGDGADVIHHAFGGGDESAEATDADAEGWEYDGPQGVAADPVAPAPDADPEPAEKPSRARK